MRRRENGRGVTIEWSGAGQQLVQTYRVNRTAAVNHVRIEPSREWPIGRYRVSVFTIDDSPVIIAKGPYWARP